MANILIIDDDEQLRELLELFLVGLGHTVTTAADGRIALRHIRGHRPDLVVTDLIMPNQEGLETIMTLRREFPGLRIIAMSGGSVASRQGLRAATFLGAHAMLTKPFPLDDLGTAVETALAT